MKEFDYLNYHTEYSCEGTYKKKLSREVCFSEVFDMIEDDSDIKYTVLLYPGINMCVDKHRSNACLFSVQEVKNHLRQLRGIYPFSYKVIEKINEDNVPYFKVTLHIKDVPASFHKYVLTWLRYTYEYPYNVILRDAYRLKQDPEFRFMSIADLFNVVSNCCNDFVGEGHSISADNIHRPLKKEELKERIKEVDRLNDIYQFLELRKNKLPRKIDKYGTKDLEYWSQKLFDVRKPIYMKMYNAIKNEVEK